MRPFLALLSLVLVLGTFGAVSLAYGAEKAIGEDVAIRVILGEAGPSYEERLAIAHALRNRGHLRGVYGWREVPTAQDYQRAGKAWEESRTGIDPTKGADHWLSDWDLKHAKPKLTAFRFKMVETAYIGTTHFYRERKHD